MPKNICSTPLPWWIYVHHILEDKFEFKVPRFLGVCAGSWWYEDDHFLTTSLLPGPLVSSLSLPTPSPILPSFQGPPWTCIDTPAFMSIPCSHLLLPLLGPRVHTEAYAGPSSGFRAPWKEIVIHEYLEHQEAERRHRFCTDTSSWPWGVPTWWKRVVYRRVRVEPSEARGPEIDISCLGLRGIGRPLLG